MTAFHPITEVIEDIKNGKMVVLIDDEGRENEGDLIAAGSTITPEQINFMAKNGRGLICVPMTGAALDRLNLHPMVTSLSDPYKTAWTVSVDARAGISTGISAEDRAVTVRTLADEKSSADSLIRPGHVFPLRAQDGGVLVRAGHTEACVDLLRLAGRPPAGVICEIMNDDGTMARTPQLISFAERHHLKIATIEHLIEYRRRSERLISRIAETVLPTSYGEFKLIAYEGTPRGEHHLALIMGAGHTGGRALVRVHSECLTGDVFGSQRCDCGWQLQESLRRIAAHGSGVVLYMRQEGRGIGLLNKIKAYSLQDDGVDTVEANEQLGFKPDLRDYGLGAQILLDLGVREIELLTNNPRKVVGLEGYGLRIVKRLPLETKPGEKNRHYLRTKKAKLGHDLEQV